MLDERVVRVRFGESLLIRVWEIQVIDGEDYGREIVRWA